MWYNIMYFLQRVKCMKPIGTQTLKTPSLILRLVRPDDAESFVRIRSLPMPMAEAKAAVARMVQELEKPFAFHWVITKSGEVIGRIKAWDVNPYNGHLQLGYDMSADHRGQGYMTEAVRAVVHFMMMEADANRVFCSVRAGNAASRRVCEKAGMALEGVMRQHYARQDGGYDDVCIYGIIKADLEGRYEP